jgi:hypothetical protein
MPLNYVLGHANDIGISDKMPLNYVLGHANDIGISDKMPFSEEKNRKRLKVTARKHLHK